MGISIAKELQFANTKIMKCTVSFLCAAFLLFAYFLNAAFISQLVIFVFAVLNMRENLKNGFESLSSFAPNLNSLVFVSTFGVLLHGFITMSAKNNFAYAAIVLFFAALGEYFEQTFFGEVSKERCFADRLCAVILPMALTVFVVTVTVNLSARVNFYETLARSFSVLGAFCPCGAVLAFRLVAVISSKKASENGFFFCKTYVYEKLGKTREIICEQRGIVTEEDYSLYDIYTVSMEKTELLSIAAAIEKRFEHPFAAAVLSACRSVEVSPAISENCFEICGRGVGGMVLGKKYFLGNKRMFKEKKISLPEPILKMDFGGLIPLFAAENSEFCGMLLFENKKRKDVDFALEGMKRLGKRCVLVAEDERKNIRNKFDIMICEREKVLQEFKKGDRINAMVISRKPLANALVVATTQMSKDTDVFLGNGGMYAALLALIIGKKAYFFAKISMLISAIFAALFAVFAAFGIAFLPWVAAVATVAPLILIFNIMRLDVPEFFSMEEDIMFGKINYTMTIEGMNCAHCSARVKSALESVKGVSAKISLEEKTARVKCSAKTTAEELTKAVTDAGFTVTSAERV